MVMGFAWRITAQKTASEQGRIQTSVRIVPFGRKYDRKTTQPGRLLYLSDLD